MVLDNSNSGIVLDFFKDLLIVMLEMGNVLNNSCLYYLYIEENMEGVRYGGKKKGKRNKKGRKIVAVKMDM